MVFYTAAGVAAFGATFFIIFAKGELQPWAWGEKVVKQGEGEHMSAFLENNCSNGHQWSKVKEEEEHNSPFLGKSNNIV